MVFSLPYWKECCTSTSTSRIGLLTALPANRSSMRNTFTSGKLRLMQVPQIHMHCWRKGLSPSYRRSTRNGRRCSSRSLNPGRREQTGAPRRDPGIPEGAVYLHGNPHLGGDRRITSLPGRGCQPSRIAVSVGIQNGARSSSNYRTGCVCRNTVAPASVTGRAASCISVKTDGLQRLPLLQSYC